MVNNNITIVAFHGSPRKNSNSSHLLRAFLRGAGERGIRCHEVFAERCNVQCCRGCLRCNLIKRCAIKGDDWEALKQGAGHHVGSANPGERGNCVISAHNDIYGEIFRELDQLNPGDQITLFTSNQRVYTYLVTGTRVVLPTQVEVLAPTSSATVTLISCYPYLKDDKRIVVTARLLSGN